MIFLKINKAKTQERIKAAPIHKKSGIPEAIFGTKKNVVTKVAAPQMVPAKNEGRNFFIFTSIYIYF